jgi:hypothetical protein
MSRVRWWWRGLRRVFAIHQLSETNLSSWVLAPELAKLRRIEYHDEETQSDYQHSSGNAETQGDFNACDHALLVMMNGSSG